MTSWGQGQNTWHGRDDNSWSAKANQPHIYCLLNFLHVVTGFARNRIVHWGSGALEGVNPIENVLVNDLELLQVEANSLHMALFQLSPNDLVH
jgi:hypothetical protein